MYRAVEVFFLLTPSDATQEVPVEMFQCECRHSGALSLMDVRVTLFSEVKGQKVNDPFRSISMQCRCAGDRKRRGEKVSIVRERYR